MKNSITIAALAALVVAAPVLAQGADSQAPQFNADNGKQQGFRGGREGRRGGGRYGKLQQIMTADQKKQFEAIMQSSRAEGKPLFEKMQALRSQMQSGSNMDDKTKSEFAALRKQMKEHHESTNNKVMALLTPDQKAQLDKMGGLGGGKDGGFGGGRNWGGRQGGRRHHDGADAGSNAAPAAPPAQ